MADLIVKHNELINAMTDMTLQQQRIFGFIISQLPREEEIPVDRPYSMEIPVQKFAESYYISMKNAYREIEKNQDSFQTKIIQLHEKDSRTKIALLISSTYFDGEGRIEIEIHNKLLPYLVNLKKRFTAYRIKDVYQFTSAHTWRFYELLAQYKKIGKRKLTLDKIKWSLGLQGKYSRPTNLKYWIIEPAVKEINNKSDIAIQYETTKKGRKITGYQFFIRQKTQNEFKKDLTQKQNTDNNNQTTKPKETQLTMHYQMVHTKLDPVLKEYGLWKNMRNTIINHCVTREYDHNLIINRLPHYKYKYNNLPADKQKSDQPAFIYGCIKKELKMPKITKMTEKEMKNHSYWKNENNKTKNEIKRIAIYKLQNKYDRTFQEMEHAIEGSPKTNPDFNKKLFIEVLRKAIELYEYDKSLP